jgi:polyisoprenoid-binding protein YceI
MEPAVRPPRILIAAVVAIIVIAAAAGAGWWFFVREDNELATNAPAIPSDLTPSSATTPSSAPPASGQTYVVVPERSEAAYFADEKLASLPLPSTAKGSTTDIEGQFHLTDDGIALDPSRESKFTVDLTTLKSDQARRDNQVQGRGLETATYPTATFIVTSITGYDRAIPRRRGADASDDGLDGPARRPEGTDLGSEGPPPGRCHHRPRHRQFPL